MRHVTNASVEEAAEGAEVDINVISSGRVTSKAAGGHGLKYSREALIQVGGAGRLTLFLDGGDARPIGRQV